jgi:2-isopropylmalate synthase
MAADKNRIFLFDTTLRDGEQSPGISLSTREKLEIADQLARLGIDVIEAGFPITSQGDFDAVSAIAKSVREPVIAALARVVEADIDRAAEALKKAAKPRIHTFVMASDTQIEYQLRKTRDEVIDMAVKAVERAKSYVDDVEFSPMDATRADFDFLCKLVEATIDAGATVVNIPDTVGYATPDEFGKLIADLMKTVPKMNDIIVSVHCHNDLGMSTANALEAVINGAMQVEGTINGIGERAGNTALEEIAMILDTRRSTLGKYTNIKTEEISKTSRLISNLTGYQVQFNKAIFGRNAFAHSSGIHQDGVLKQRSTFEIIDPKRVGISESSLILGKTSGRHAFRMHVEGLGYQIKDEEFEGLFEKFKALADKKAVISDMDIEALLADEVRSASDVYMLEYMSVCSGTDVTPEAKVRLRKNGDEVIEMTASGDGQVAVSYTHLTLPTN